MSNGELRKLKYNLPFVKKLYQNLDKLPSIFIGNFSTEANVPFYAFVNERTQTYHFAYDVLMLYTENHGLFSDIVQIPGEPVKSIAMGKISIFPDRVILYALKSQIDHHDIKILETLAEKIFKRSALIFAGGISKHPLNKK